MPNPSHNMSNAEVKTPYDVVLCREVSPEECMCAAVAGTLGLPVPKVNKLPTEVIDQCRGKKVLVCGSYYDQASLEALADVASDVKVFFYSEGEKNKYGDRFSKTAVFELLDTSTTEKYPWSARVRKGAQSMAEDKFPEDEAFYRGLIFEIDSRGLSLYDGFCAMRDGKMPSEDE